MVAVCHMRLPWHTAPSMYIPPPSPFDFVLSKPCMGSHTGPTSIWRCNVVERELLTYLSTKKQRYASLPVTVASTADMQHHENKQYQSIDFAIIHIERLTEVPEWLWAEGCWVQHCMATSVCIKVVDCRAYHAADTCCKKCLIVHSAVCSILCSMESMYHVCSLYT